MLRGWIGRATDSRRGLYAACLLALLFAVLGGRHIGALGMPAEEVIPHLFGPTRVVVWAEAQGDDPPGLKMAAPHNIEPDTGATPSNIDGVVTRKVWPVMAWYQGDNVYPILVESWQAAYLSYVAKAASPVLGGGIEGPRRLTLLLGLLSIFCVFALGLRATGPPELERDRVSGAVLGATLLATSVTWLFMCRTAYHIEVAPPVAVAVATLLVLHGSALRFVLAGLIAGLAVSLKVTAAWPIFGVALGLWWAGAWPRQSLKSWAIAVGLALLAVLPILWFLLFADMPNNVSNKAVLLSDPLGGLARIPTMILLIFSVLGDPLLIMTPLLTGATDVSPHWWQPVVPAVVYIAAIWHVRKSPDSALPERLLLCVFAVICVIGGILYNESNPFQVVFLLLPFYVLVMGRAVWRLGCWGARFMPRRVALTIVVTATLGLQGYQLAQFNALHDRVGNPMLSMPGQRELADALEEQGIKEPLTMTYNAVGGLEMLSEGRLRPIHLHRVLTSGDTGEGRMARDINTWRLVLTQWQNPIVVPIGTNMFEGGGFDVAAVRQALDTAAKELGLRLHQKQTFPSVGPPMFALLEVRPLASSPSSVK